jgi:hypothetical protein
MMRAMRTLTSLNLLVSALALAPLLVGGAGCLEGFPQPKTGPTSKPAAAGKTTPDKDGKAATGKAATSKAAAAGKTAAGKTGVPPTQDGYLSGAHILIAYTGAQRSKATRSKAEALALAKKLATQVGLKVAPATFAALARKHSDGPSGQNGGDLGTWKKGRMVAAFDKAILTLPFNGVTAEPVETPFGFHLIMRYRVFDNIKLDAAQVLISHIGARRKPDSVTRTPADARALCQKVAKLAVGKTEAGFAKLVATYSEAPDKAGGGRLGGWNARTSPLPAAINRTVYELKIGAVSAPVMSPFGCHVLLRLKPKKP